MIVSSPAWPDTFKIGKRCQERYISFQDYKNLKKDIITAGLSELRLEYMKSQTGKPFHTMIFTYGGAGYIKTIETQQSLEMGSLLILPANQFYELGIRGPRWDVCWFHLATSSRWASLEKIIIQKSQWCSMVVNATNALYQELNNPPQSQPIAAYIVEQIDAYLHREMTSECEADRPLNFLFEKVESQLQYPWTVPIMAQISHYSIPHFHKLCKKNFGLGPIQYLTFLRMKRAKHLLTETNNSISSIAKEVGYENLFNFSKAFKREEKQAPSVYRKQFSQS